MLFRVLYLLPALLLGLTLSQAPEFAQQYRQRLGGALDELTDIITRFDADARRQGLTRNAAVDRLAANADPLARDRADDIRIVVARRDRLARQQAALAAAGPFARVVELTVDFDPGVAGRAWQSFEPAVPATLEGIATAGVGLALGLLLAETTRIGVKRQLRRRRRGRPSG